MIIELAQWFLARLGILEQAMTVFHRAKNHCVAPLNVMRHGRPARWTQFHIYNHGQQYQ
jgi:hypothetical protein